MIEGQNVKRAGISIFSIILSEIHIFYTINLSNMYVFCYICKNKTANDMIKEETAEMLANGYKCLAEVKKACKEIEKRINISEEEGTTYNLFLSTNTGEELVGIGCYPSLALDFMNKIREILERTQKSWNDVARKELEEENQV